MLLAHVSFPLETNTFTTFNSDKLEPISAKWDLWMQAHFPLPTPSAVDSLHGRQRKAY